MNFENRKCFTVHLSILNPVFVNVNLFIAGASILLFVFIPQDGIGFSICPFFNLFHFPCPGCGMGRALISIYHLQFWDALKYHPFAYIFTYYQIKYFLFHLFEIKRNIFPNHNSKLALFFASLLPLYYTLKICSWKYFPELGNIFFNDIRNTKRLIDLF